MMATTPEEILDALASADDLRTVVRTLTATAPLPALVEAIRRASAAHLRGVLYRVVADVRSVEALDVLVSGLTSDAAAERSTAAGALGTIVGYPGAHPAPAQVARARRALLAALTAESVPGVRASLLAALALCDNTSDIALLEAGALASDPAIRNQARWGLAHLRRDRRIDTAAVVFPARTPLPEQVRAILLLVANHLDDERDILLGQIEHLVLLQGSPEQMTFYLPADAPRLGRPDGPLPLDITQRDEQAAPLADLTLYLEGGQLSALERSPRDDVPDSRRIGPAWPPVGRVTIG